ncbi:MAG: hypothetical protein ACKVN9_04720 [Methylophilaceae bacterium]
MKSLIHSIARHKLLEACLVALLIMVTVFPDVIFLRASFSLTDNLIGSQHGSPPKRFYHLPSTTGWYGSYNDNGGAIFQSEPMIEFMRHSIWHGQSPYWNPYSAAGSFGPETLVDQKFSAFTLTNALLGGGSKIYNATMLVFLYFAVFFMYRIARERLGLSVLAGVGISLFYLLNGYSAANFGSNVAQSYLYVPMVLYTSLTFLEKATIGRFVAIVLSFAVFLSCTFIPTTLTSFIAIYAVLLGYVSTSIKWGELKIADGVKLLLLQIAGVVLSVLLLSVMYLPIFENIKSTGTLEAYAIRIFYPIFFPQAIASFFSSTHLYESYNAMEAAAVGFTGNTVFHMGLVGIVLASCASSLRKGKYNPLIIFCAVCVVLAIFRVFEVPLVSGAISHIPILGKVGCQYWWPPIMLPMAILIGFGINNLQQSNARIWPSFILLLIGLAGIFYVYETYGLVEPHIKFKVKALIGLGVLAVTIVILLLKLRAANKDKSARIILSLVVLLLVELMLDSKMIRLPRSALFSAQEEAVSFVRKHAGLYRTLNFGQTGLYPELGSALQIQEVTSMNQGVIPAYEDYFYSAIQIPRGSFPALGLIQDKPEATKFNWQALDILGVKYVFLPVNFIAYKNELQQRGLRLVFESPSTLVFENPEVLPRAFAVDLPDGELNHDFNLPADFSEHIQPATISAYQNASVEISGTAAQQMLVVISDNWHQRWHASVNGREVSIIRVNGTFRGVVVPKGSYIIKMHYQPGTLPLAMGISSGVLLLLIIMIFSRRRLDGWIHPKWALWA